MLHCAWDDDEVEAFWRHRIRGGSARHRSSSSFRSYVLALRSNLRNSERLCDTVEAEAALRQLRAEVSADYRCAKPPGRAFHNRSCARELPRRLLHTTLRHLALDAACDTTGAYTSAVRSRQPYASALTLLCALCSDFCDAYLTHDSVRFDAPGEAVAN